MFRAMCSLLPDSMENSVVALSVRRPKIERIRDSVTAQHAHFMNYYFIIIIISAERSPLLVGRDVHPSFSHFPVRGFHLRTILLQRLTFLQGAYLAHCHFKLLILSVISICPQLDVQAPILWVVRARFYSCHPSSSRNLSSLLGLLKTSASDPVRSCELHYVFFLNE